MKIIAKSFPVKEQIQGRINSGAFDGIEIFVLPSVLDNPSRHKEAVKLARDNFPVVNFETFYSVKINGVNYSAGLLDPKEGVREQTKALLEATVELNAGKGNINTHFVGYPVLSAEDARKMPSLNEQLFQIGERLSQFKPVITLENVIAYDPLDAGGTGAVYPNGCDIGDFAQMRRQFGIPMTLDTAHLAICLQQYSLAVKKEKIIKNMPVKFSNKRIELGENVLNNGLMKIWLEQINQLPLGAVRNMHFINTRVKEDGKYQDGYYGFSQRDGRLLNLDKALVYLNNRGDVEYAVAEVVDSAYQGKTDWNNVPKMVKMARILRAKL